MESTFINHLITDPELWTALGYKQLPQKVEIIEQDNTTTRINTISISPAQMNILANKVLMSKKTNFTAEEYSTIIPKFRKTQKEWISKGYLKANSDKNPRLGFSFTKKGMDVLYEFASDEFKIKRK